MTHKTKGIVLRTVKYGETSLVVTIFTELFGIQTYMVNGIRSSGKSGAKAAQFQPSAILDMEVYHNDLKAMNRIKESSWAVVYQDNLTDVVKNSIALYMVELLNKLLKQPEPNADLFYFSEEALTGLDEASPEIAANLPLYFTLHLPYFFGFRISLNNIKNESMFLDLVEGTFIEYIPEHRHYLNETDAAITGEILRTQQLSELKFIRLNSVRRRELLMRYQEYYSLHIQDFGKLKTLEILGEVLG